MLTINQIWVVIHKLKTNLNKNGVEISEIAWKTISRPLKWFILLLNQNETEVSHFFWKSILRFSQLLLLMRFWEKDKRIERKCSTESAFEEVKSANGSREKRKILKIGFLSDEKVVTSYRYFHLLWTYNSHLILSFTI